LENNKFSKIDDKFLQWFVGFVEGEGCFLVANRNSELTFTVTQAEKEILDEI